MYLTSLYEEDVRGRSLRHIPVGIQHEDFVKALASDLGLGQVAVDIVAHHLCMHCGCLGVQFPVLGYSHRYRLIHILRRDPDMGKIEAEDRHGDVVRGICPELDIRKVCIELGKTVLYGIAPGSLDQGILEIVPVNGQGHVGALGAIEESVQVLFEAEECRASFGRCDCQNLENRRSPAETMGEQGNPGILAIDELSVNPSFNISVHDDYPYTGAGPMSIL